MSARDDAKATHQFRPARHGYVCMVCGQDRAHEHHTVSVTANDLADAKAAHPSQVRRGSVADDPDQPQAGGTSPAAGLGDLDNIVVDLNDAIQRLRKLKRKQR